MRPAHPRRRCGLVAAHGWRRTSSVSRSATWPGACTTRRRSATSAEAFLRAQRAAREHLKRADPFRGERLRREPALPRRTTAALREQPRASTAAGCSRPERHRPRAGPPTPALPKRAAASRPAPSATAPIPQRSPAARSPRRPRRRPAGGVSAALPPRPSALPRRRRGLGYGRLCRPQARPPVAARASCQDHRDEGNPPPCSTAAATWTVTEAGRTRTGSAAAGQVARTGPCRSPRTGAGRVRAGRPAARAGGHRAGAALPRFRRHRCARTPRRPPRPATSSSASSSEIRPTPDRTVVAGSRRVSGPDVALLVQVDTEQGRLSPGLDGAGLPDPAATAAASDFLVGELLAAAA